MNLKEYIEFIQTHDAEDLINLILAESWLVFQKESGALKVGARDYSYYFLLRSFGDRVASIAYAFDTNNGKYKVTRTDLSIMLQLYLDITENFTKNPFGDNQKKDLEVLSTYPLWSRFAEQNSYTRLSILIPMNRMMRIQHGIIKASGRGIQRSYGIFKIYIEKINNSQELLMNLNKTLGMNILDIYRASYCLMGIMYNSYGVYHSANALTTDSDIKNLNITQDTINLLARRWSWNKETLYEWFLSYLSNDNPDQKYFPSPLVKNPLFQILPMDSDQDSYILPSPWAYIAKSIHYIEENLVLNIPEKNNNEAMEMLGHSFSEFTGRIFNEICGKDNVIDLALYEDKKTQIADYILIEDDYALIVEMKRSLSSIDEMSFSETEAIGTMIERALRAVEQAHATKLRMGSFDERFKTITKIAYVVCYKQSLVHEGNIITTFYYNSSARTFYDSPLAIFDIDEFEQFLLNHGVKTLYNLIEYYGLNINKNINKSLFYEKDNAPTELKIYHELSKEIVPDSLND